MYVASTEIRQVLISYYFRRLSLLKSVCVIVMPVLFFITVEILIINLKI